MDKGLFFVDFLLVLFVLNAVDAISLPRTMEETIDDDEEEIPSWSRCPFIRNKLKNGRVKLRSRGRIAKFMCDPGYELAGKRFTTCVRGQWNNPIPVCVSRGCSRPPVVSNARVSEMYRGAVLLYECLPGYSMQGGGTVYCDGRQWSSEAPVCEVSTTNPLVTCDFEDPNLCGWSHDPTHDFDWKRNQFDTPSGHVGTGPTSDHTFGPGKGGFYLYMEASSPRKVNDTARLFSPVYHREHSGGCFVFWYHMFGSTTGGLRIYVRPESQVFGELLPTWTEYGDQGNRWFRGNVTIPQINENFQIVIEGIRGSSYIGDTAIDDVSLNSEDCSNIRNFTEHTSEFVSNSCRGRCREANESYSCGCNDECIASTSGIPCCDDFFELCTKSSHETENPEEYSAYVTTPKLVTVKTSPKPESSSITHTTTSTFSTTLSHSSIPLSVTEMSTTSNTSSSRISTPSTPIFVASTTPTPNAISYSSSVTTKILSTTSTTTSILTTKSSPTSLPPTFISTKPSTSTNARSTTSTIPSFRSSSMQHTTSATPSTTLSMPITASTPSSTILTTPSTTLTTFSTTLTTPSTTLTTSSTTLTTPSTTLTTPISTSIKPTIPSTTSSKTSITSFTNLTLSSTATPPKTSTMKYTTRTKSFTASIMPFQPSITALTTSLVTPTTPSTAKSTTSTMRPTTSKLSSPSSTNINPVSSTKSSISVLSSLRPSTITTARNTVSTKITPLTSASTIKTTSLLSSTTPTITASVTNYPKFVSTKTTTRYTNIYPVTVQETRTYNLRPRYRTTPTPLTRTDLPLDSTTQRYRYYSYTQRYRYYTSTQRYRYYSPTPRYRYYSPTPRYRFYSFTTKPLTRIPYSRLPSTTITTPSTSLVTSTQLASTASSSPITTEITSMSKKPQHSSTSASTVSDSSHSTVTIVSVVLVLAVCTAGGLIFYFRRWKARRQSKLADDSEMRFLYENEFAEFSDASALEKMNSYHPLI